METAARYRDEDFERARTACIKHADDLLRRPNLYCVSVGFKIIDGKVREDVLCVSAYVQAKRDAEQLEKDEVLPKELTASDGTMVPVDVVPMIRPVAQHAVAAFERQRGLRIRRRPAFSGDSVGHPQVTAGTLGAVVIDSADPSTFYLLSNNHVIANSNGARYGDAILQPGLADGGRYPRDVIGHLQRCIPIQFGLEHSNLVDAAIARICFCDVDRRVYCIGYPNRALRKHQLFIGQHVQKTGRTTGYTAGHVVGLHAIVNVGYPGGRLARFHEQILTTPMSEGGDSGSLVLDFDRHAVGLLFAGSPTHTILNAIEDVEDELGITVAPPRVDA